MKNRLSFLVLCVAAGLASSSSAQPAKNPGTAAAEVRDPCLQDAKCNEFYETARALSEAGQYEGALVNYQSAFTRKPMPWLLINIGRMQQKAGRPQRAIRSYEQYLSNPAANDAELQNTVRNYLQEAQREMWAADPAAPGSINSAAPTMPADQPRPIYKKWWFWTLLGVGVAGAVVTSVVVSQTGGIKEPAHPANYVAF